MPPFLPKQRVGPDEWAGKLRSNFTLLCFPTPTMHPSVRAHTVLTNPCPTLSHIRGSRFKLSRQIEQYNVVVTSNRNASRFGCPAFPVYKVVAAYTVKLSSPSIRECLHIQWSKFQKWYEFMDA